MKKFFLAILALIYISTSTGAVLHIHYCMGKIVDWGIGNNDSKTCGKCGMKKSAEKNNGCCKDVHKFYKDDSAQKITESNLQFLQVSSLALPVDYIELPLVEFPAKIIENPYSHAPPRTPGVSVYILNCTFLI